MRLRVLICDDVKIDIIIGLPSIKSFNLLPVLTQHIAGVSCCEICGDEEALRTVERNNGVSMTYGSDGHTHLTIAGQPVRKGSFTQNGTRKRAVKKTGALAQHSGYSGDMEIFYLYR
jgi:hypothetical protein